MVVLATADPFGGVLTYATELAALARSHGVRTVLALFGSPPARGPDVYAAPFRLEWMDDPWDDVQRSCDWLAELVREIQPDVLHLNTYAHATLDVRVPRVVAAHSCVPSWWRAVKGEEAPASYDLYREVVREGLARADVVVAPTLAYAWDVVERYGPLRDVRVIPNGIAPAAAPPRAGPPVVLAAGRLWDPAKNLAALDRVAGRLPWEVRVAGEGTSPDGHCVPTAHVTRLGRVTRPSALVEMERAAVFCHPARYEPFGLAPLEAAARGCALVLGDLPTLREVWGDAALYAPPDDEDALAEAITRLMSDPPLRAAFADAARRRAARFPLSAQVERMVALYRSLAQESP